MPRHARDNPLLDAARERGAVRGGSERGGVRGDDVCAAGRKMPMPIPSAARTDGKEKGKQRRDAPRQLRLLRPAVHADHGHVRDGRVLEEHALELRGRHLEALAEHG